MSALLVVHNPRGFITFLLNNLWTMGQQFFVIRRMPTPGSPAAKALAERRTAKGMPALPILNESRGEAASLPSVTEPAGQRIHPQRRNRKKK